jgi:hypothetical protein
VLRSYRYGAALQRRGVATARRCNGAALQRRGVATARAAALRCVSLTQCEIQQRSPRKMQRANQSV